MLRIDRTVHVTSYLFGSACLAAGYLVELYLGRTSFRRKIFPLKHETLATSSIRTCEQTSYIVPQPISSAEFPWGQ